MKINFIKEQKGFTVLETLVAIAILIISLTAAFSVVQSGLSLSISSRDEVTAYYLAQEAIEMIRNSRDENSLNALPWLAGIADDSGDPCYFGNYCTVDSPNKYFESCGTEAGECSNLKQDQDSESPTFGMYGIDPDQTSSWGTTPFKREIFLKSITSDEIAVTVTIYWTKGVTTRNFVIHDNLFDWQI